MEKLTRQVKNYLQTSPWGFKGQSSKTFRYFDICDMLQEWRFEDKLIKKHINLSLLSEKTQDSLLIAREIANMVARELLSDLNIETSKEVEFEIL